MEKKTGKEEEKKGDMVLCLKVTWGLARCPQEDRKHTGETSHSLMGFVGKLTSLNSKAIFCIIFPVYSYLIIFLGTTQIFSIS